MFGNFMFAVDTHTCKIKLTRHFYDFGILLSWHSISFAGRRVANVDWAGAVARGKGLGENDKDVSLWERALLFKQTDWIEEELDEMFLCFRFMIMRIEINFEDQYSLHFDMSHHICIWNCKIFHSWCRNIGHWPLPQPFVQQQRSATEWRSLLVFSGSPYKVAFFRWSIWRAARSRWLFWILACFEVVILKHVHTTIWNYSRNINVCYQNAFLCSESRMTRASNPRNLFSANMTLHWESI
jgi:hypothetical protein